LIGRAETAPAVASTRVAESFASMALLADPALDVRQYLEDLVSIAVNSAHQAEDLAVQAREAGRKARRSMAVVASLGAMGLVVGVAGFAASRSANVRLSEVRGEIGALHEMQRQSQDQLAEIAARTSEQREAVEVTQRSSIAPAVVMSQPVPAPVPPARQPTVRYSEPWPDSRPPPRRAAVVRSQPVQTAQPVVVPRFFADIQHSLRGIFH
jgi:triphosphoribosyl-dephospho-CoA synthetase